MIILFLGMSGFFTWLFGSSIFLINQASLQVFFGISYWTLFFFIPAITMRSLAEENKSGTIELLSTKAVSDREIVVSVPAGTEPGAHQLTVVTAGGVSTVNGLTFHIWGRVPGNRYEPNVYEVGPGRTYDPANYDGTAGGPIQAAIDAAWASGGNQGDLVVVYPGVPVPMINPLGMYIENPVIYAPVKLQGVGPGGSYPDAPAVPGAIVDGRAVGGDSPYNQWWRQVLIPDIWNNRGGWDRGLEDGDGNPRLYEGAAITLFGEKNEFRESFVPAVDGFIIQGGDQSSRSGV